MTFFIKNDQINGNLIKVDKDDSHHIKNVLRMEEGDFAYFCDEKETKYRAKFEMFKEGYAYFTIIDEVDDTTEPTVNITLFQGLPKAEKMDLIVQKCTELGVNAVVPTIMERSIVKVDDNSSSKKHDRWQKIAKEAARAIWKA